MTIPANLTIEEVVASATEARDSAGRSVAALREELTRAEASLAKAQERLDHWLAVQQSQGATA